MPSYYTNALQRFIEKLGHSRNLSFIGVVDGRLCPFFIMKKIPLTQGQFALVDDEDYDFLMQWKWYAVKSRGTYYAVRHTKKDLNRTRLLIRMHRFIMGDEAVGLQVDHMDLCGLNNQRANLRCCTHEQNMRNYPKPRTNKSGYKGVSWSKTHNSWRVPFCVNGKKTTIGCYKNILDAARAYDTAAKKYHGDFARLNFPDE